MNRFNNRLGLMFLFLLSSFAAVPQPRPDAQCTSVDGNTITITWMVDSQDFDRYYFEKSYDGLNFSLIEPPIPDPSLQLFSYTETSSYMSPIYYRIYTEKGSTKSLISDTIAIIFLKLETDINNAIAHLTWNRVSKNAGGFFNILRKASTASWQLIYSSENMEYFDTITSPFCSDTLMYYTIEYLHPGISDTSFSTTDSATLSDGVYPGWKVNDIVQMDTVSVDFQGNVAISWEAYAASDIQQYSIYRNDMIQSGWYVIDSVPGDQYSYFDTQSTANLESVLYRVAAKDTCHAPGPGGFAQPFGTIFLRPVNWNYCDTAAFLQWDSTLWMEPYPELFSIFAIDTSTLEYQLAGETTQIHYSHATGFKPDTTYCYFVRANNSEGKSSTSCIQCFYVNRPEQPDTLHLQVASVDTNFNDRINVSVFVDIIPADTKCSLLRKVNISDPYDTVLTLTVSQDDILSFADTSAKVEETPYYYKTIILDGCDNASWLPVNEVRTIHLKGSVYDQTNHLFWNRYQSSVSHVTGYRLYRKINGLVDTIIDVALDTVYDDLVSSQAQISGRFSYLVEARIFPLYEEVADTLSGFSNEILLIQLSRINMPNAFTPNSDGYNDYFGPRNIFTEDQTEYLFTIYNRWGQRVFESTSINDPGWDGTFQGKPSPYGVYVFFIRYVSIEGEIFEEKGTFTLIR